jgi:hypothetical protein
MNDYQIYWAAQHDWFVSANYAEGSVTVMDDIAGLKTFTDWKQLRDWGGY